MDEGWGGVKAGLPEEEADDTARLAGLKKVAMALKSASKKKASATPSKKKQI